MLPPSRLCELHRISCSRRGHVALVPLQHATDEPAPSGRSTGRPGVCLAIRDVAGHGSGAMVPMIYLLFAAVIGLGVGLTAGASAGLVVCMLLAAAAYALRHVISDK